MFSALAKSVVAGAALSLALAAAPAKAAEKAPLVAEKASVVLTEGEAAPAEGGGKVWFAFMWPDNLKPQLEEKKILLTAIGVLLPFGSVWGPIVLLGQPFDLEWALPSIVFHALGTAFYWVYYIPYLAGGWIATQCMFANLNRPEIQVGGGEPAVKTSHEK
ncbi:MAG: hypothetical protein AB2A00_40035 [Myxococcota bacterium]